VRELRSTVLQREQWRHGAEGEGEGAAALGGGEGAALHCSRCRTVETWCRRRMRRRRKGRRRRRGRGRRRAGYSSAARHAIVTVL